MVALFVFHQNEKRYSTRVQGSERVEEGFDGTVL
jgi:hypothetical protein